MSESPQQTAAKQDRRVRDSETKRISSRSSRFQQLFNDLSTNIQRTFSRDQQRFSRLLALFQQKIVSRSRRSSRQSAQIRTAAQQESGSSTMQQSRQSKRNKSGTSTSEDPDPLLSGRSSSQVLDLLSDDPVWILHNGRRIRDRGHTDAAAHANTSRTSSLYLAEAERVKRSLPVPDSSAQILKLCKYGHDDEDLSQVKHCHIRSVPEHEDRHWILKQHEA